MADVFWVRFLAYSIVPLVLAAAHGALDPAARTAMRRAELFVMYLLGVSVGAGGLGGAFGHLFLSDTVAESIGWPTGSPFQLEMAFANLAVGVLGLIAISRRDGFRLATVLATAILGGGATAVHVWDIATTGNLAPGNTIQNAANLLDPILLIALLAWAARRGAAEQETPEFAHWQMHQQIVVALAAVGVGTGFGLGYVVDAPLLGTVLGTVAGVGLGWFLRARATITTSART